MHGRVFKAIFPAAFSAAAFLFCTAPQAVAVAPYPLEDTFFLHSNPGSNYVVYIDADGYDGELGYDRDDDPSTFNDDERERIQRMWARVKEDYLPFDVDITTEYPGQEALIRDLFGGDDEWGIRVVIYQGSGENGGNAGRWSFYSTTDKPAWADQNGVGTGNKNLGEVISHEVGHSLGLAHDGRNLSPEDEKYYYGHGSGSTGWAPIMGSGYSREVTQWSKGDYADADNQQDDLAAITNGEGNLLYDGIGYRDDDHGSSIGSASELNLVGGIALQDEGIIERSTDKDVFHFTVAFESPVNLSIDPAEIGANLDIQARLLDSNGAEIAISNPLGELNAEFDLSLPAGEYYIEIDGVGSTGDPSTGYDDYASLGYFSISGTVFTPLVADLNGNGTVEAGDIAFFQQGWLTTGHATIEEQIAHGDFNLDGITDLADAFLMHQALQTSGNGALASQLWGNFSVPEPSSLAMLGLASLVFGLRRKNR